MSMEQIKHLELIQAIITRMNTNSFQIKQWTVTLVSSFLALFASTKNEYFILAGLFPSIVFWFLDSYYLQQERKFRGLYNDVAGISETPKQIKVFEMPLDLYFDGKYSFVSSFKSTTILTMYLSITVILVALFLFLKNS